MINNLLNNRQIVGQIGPDGRPIGLLDAMMGVRPPVVDNPFNVPKVLGIDYSNLRKELGEKPAMMQQSTGIMDTMRNFFGMPSKTTDVVDGQNITYVDRVNLPNPNATEAANVADAASGQMNPMMAMAALEGLLSNQQPQFMPMVQQQATPGLNLNTADLTKFYGGILNG
jgi:hypothetical protein|tara:strand:- start:937 stop:1446 length:510 start_codon:yes stop_codon:yes gene_type:complete